MSESDRKLDPEEIVTTDDLAPLRDTMEELENAVESAATKDDVPSRDDVVDLIDEQSEMKTRALLEHLAHEDCDTAACQDLREQFGIGPGDDLPDGEGEEAPDDADADSDTPTPSGEEAADTSGGADGGEEGADDDPEEEKSGWAAETEGW